MVDQKPNTVHSCVLLNPTTSLVEISLKSLPRPAELDADAKIETSGKMIYGDDLLFKGTSHGAPLSIVPEAKANGLKATLPKYSVGSKHQLNFVRAVKGAEERNCRISFFNSDAMSPLQNFTTLQSR